MAIMKLQKEIIERAPAKINLGLNVLGRRNDDYHELEMVMASIDLADQLEIQMVEQDEILIQTDKSFLPVDERNHVYQAVQLMKKEFGMNKGVHIKLRKNIPVAAGLAGGSSDAAAALRGLNRLWNLGLSLPELAELGMQIGSDVPYCIYGCTAFVGGRGEQIEFLPPMPQCWIVVVKPRFSVSTGEIYQALDLDTAPHPDIQLLRKSIEEEDYQAMIEAMGNTLECVTIQNYPKVGQIKEKIQKFGADVSLMSGSGPTVFGLCEKYSRAQRLCNGLRGFCEEVYLVRTLNK